ncbi:rRNA biogenesis protein rrp36 [Elasticomyces elasticus]|nr:rRNA biogenesis protein rrp36 [Elasticomyces elasticus]
MAPVKRMERNVRAPKITQKQDEDEDMSEEEEMVEDEGSGSEMESEVEVEEDEDADVQAKISNISFGALKQAQDAVGSRKRKRGSNDSPAAADDDKLEALRKRLKQIKEQKGSLPTTITNHDDAEDSDGSDSDSAPSEEGGHVKSRTSKHAPASQTTKHQVTRKRTVISYPKLVTRDPRFDNIPFQAPTTAHAPNDASDKAYAFLRDYQKDEVGELRAALRKTKDEDEKELLRRKINSMENRLKSHAAKEREQAVRAEHRKEEKGRVLEGKKPYFLKDKEVKERALVKKFEGMKGREREKIVAKRALKESQKEKRAMPRDRRLAR